MSVVRRLGIAAAIVVGLLLAAALLLPSLVSLDATRAKILAASESSLHRKVEAGAIRLEIFSGLGAGIDRFVIHNGDGWQSPALASADRLSVKVAFWPLLSGRIEIRKIVLDGATLSIERAPDGRWNIDDLLAASPGEEPPASAAGALLVSRLEIARGRFVFLDRKVSPGRTVSVALDDVAAQVSDVGPATAARFELDARFLADKGRNLSVNGTLGPPVEGKSLGQAPLKATLSAKGMSLALLGPYLASAASLDPGALSLDGTLDGAFLGALAMAGNLSLAPPKTSAIPPIEGKFAMTLDWPAGTLVISKSPVSAAQVPLVAEGRIDGLRTEMRLALRFATAEEVGVDRIAAIPRVATAMPAGWKLSGRMRLAGAAEGPTSAMAVRLDADVAQLTVSGGADPVFSAPALHASVVSKGKEPISFRAAAAVAQIRKLPVEAVIADGTWQGGALTLVPSLRCFGGAIRGRIERDFSRPGSEARIALDVDRVQAEPLLESFSTMRNVIGGSLTARVTATTRGFDWSTFSKTGRGEGRLTLADADIRTVELMPKVAANLREIGRVAGFQVPANLESTRFTTLETGLSLADGRVATPGLTLSGKDVSATADGSLGLDRTLSYEGRVVLGAALVKSFGNAGRYVADDQGRLALPFRATGPIASPKVSIDESIVLELGRRILMRRARDWIPTGGSDANRPAGGGAGKTDPVDLLQQFLQAAPRPTPTPHTR